MKAPVSLRKQILVFLIVILFIFMTILPPNGRSTGIVNKTGDVAALDNSGLVNESNIQTQSVVLNITEPIAIDGNANLITTAANSVWSGDGSKDAPFIIEYLNITGNAGAPAIAITGTSLYITIQHSIFDNATSGITLENVQNTLIYNNTISNSHEGGILVTSATNNNINVSRNIITKNTYRGVYMTSTGKANVSDNQIEYNGWSGIVLSGSDKIVERNFVTRNNNSGIYLTNPVNVQVRGNIVYENSQSGGAYNSITLASAGSNNIVEDNIVVISGANGIGISFIDDSIIRNNTVYVGPSAALRLSESNNNEIYDNYFWLTSLGIYIDFASDNNHIHNNIIYQMQTEGILLGDSVSNTLIHNNTISKSTTTGIEIMNTVGGGLRTGNQIYWNNFINNNDRAFQTTQAYDSHGDNNFTSNFWDDIWVGTDGNGDGFIDTPYFVDELLANTANDDAKPLAGPVNPEQHFRGEMYISNLEDGEILNKWEEIRWASVTDLWGHSFTYSLYYSPDAITWTEIQTGIMTNSYMWNTDGAGNGTGFRLKIVLVDDKGYTQEHISTLQFTIIQGTQVITLAELILPNEGDLIGGNYTISWTTGASSWDVDLLYFIRYSPDNGTSWYGLDEKLESTFYNWETESFPDGNYVLKVGTSGANELSFGPEIRFILNNTDYVAPTSTSTTNVTTTPVSNFTTSSTPTTSDSNITSSTTTTTTSSFIINTEPIGGTSTTEDSKTDESTSDSSGLPMPFLAMLGAFIVISLIRLVRPKKRL